jgi:hypothetical protein
MQIKEQDMILTVFYVVLCGTKLLQFVKGRIGLVVSALDLKPGDPGSSLGVAHETNA